MKVNITEHLTCIERDSLYGTDYYSKYIPDYFISTRMFEAAVKQLGGYKYCSSIAKIETVFISNYSASLVVHSIISYEDADMWAKRFEQTLFALFELLPSFDSGKN